MANYVDNLQPSAFFEHEEKVFDVNMLVYGPQQPENDIDVYLAPLIEDLQTLWDDGVNAYDAYCQEYFTLSVVSTL